MTALLESITVPVMFPRSLCANAETASTKIATVALKRRSTIDLHIP
jgi:hypothetical protein